ncbi:hypothetical protein, partial [Streptococcus pneumoniae]
MLQILTELKKPVKKQKYWLKNAKMNWL